MTVIQDRVEDVAGVGSVRRVTFTTRIIRESADGTAIVEPVRHPFTLVDGNLTTSDLDPGPAKVLIGKAWFDIVIPVSSTPVRLWPLIDAGMPAPTGDTTGFVRNGRGVRRVEAVTSAEYASMTQDPATFYIITDEVI